MNIAANVATPSSAYSLSLNISLLRYVLAVPPVKRLYFILLKFSAITKDMKAQLAASGSKVVVRELKILLARDADRMKMESENMRCGSPPKPTENWIKQLIKWWNKL